MGFTTINIVSQTFELTFYYIIIIHIILTESSQDLQIALIVFVCLFTINQFNQLEAVMIVRNFLIAIVTITTIVSLLLYIIIWLKAVGSK